tara:strand:+ start:1514 stop:1795 length:282 start_codon:yes stop_codon:yes gene_type:complete
MQDLSKLTSSLRDIGFKESNLFTGLNCEPPGECLFFNYARSSPGQEEKAALRLPNNSYWFIGRELTESEVEQILNLGARDATFDYVRYMQESV